MVVDIPSGSGAVDGEFLLHRLFEAQVHHTPEATAIRSDEGELSYSALDRRANQLAHHLVQSGAGPETVIGICLDRSPDMIIALLAILKSGSAYLPLDGDLPPDRLAYMARDAAAHCIVTSRQCAKSLDGIPAKRIMLDDDHDAIAALPDRSPQIELHPHNLAYLLYTSGSTGLPKAVMGTHIAIYNRIAWEYGVTMRSDVLPFKLSLGQIDSLWEIFAPLCGGGEVAIIAQRDKTSISGLVKKFIDHQVTALVVVSSLLDALLDETGFDSRSLPKLKYIASTGEPLPDRTVARVARAFPDIDFADIYGTTEFWDAHSTSLVRSGRRDKPLNLCDIHILDDHLQPVEPGEIGEIFVAGHCLARGYFGQPALTASKFIPSPFTAGQRMYRTGDCGELNADGELKLHGRRDRQVNILGNRVELDEIENQILHCASVKQAVVLLSEDGRVQTIRAFVTASAAIAESSQDALATEILAHLRTRLPRHMLPHAIEVMDRFPVSTGGKIDRKALLQRPEPPREALLHAPLTEIESQLACHWRELLPAADIHKSSNFFNLGGNSLLAMQLIARIFHNMGVQATLSDIFETPTLEAMATRIAAKAALPEPNEMDDDASLLALIDSMSEDEIVTALLKLGENVDD